MDSHDEVEALARQRGPALVGYAYLLTGDLTTAQDVVQDAFVRMLVRRSAGQAPEHAEAYLRKAILNGVRDGYRRHRTFLGARPRLVEQDGRAMESLAVAHLDLQRALATLTSRERACVVLRYVDDLSIREVAAALRLGEGTVKRYLSDARAQLGGLLGEEPSETIQVDQVPDARPVGRRTR